MQHSAEKNGWKKCKPLFAVEIRKYNELAKDGERVFKRKAHIPAINFSSIGIQTFLYALLLNMKDGVHLLMGATTIASIASNEF